MQVTHTLEPIPADPSTSEQCCIEGCGRAILNKGRQLCRRHYGRFLKHGDPLATGRPDLGFTLEERLWSKVNKNGNTVPGHPELGPCWLWTGGFDNGGYARIIVMGEKRGYPRRPQRLLYEWLIGQIPDGLSLDHLCHTLDMSCRGGNDCPHRPCVNPWHMDPVTTEENTRRGQGPSSVNARKSECIRGHAFTAENTYVTRRGKRQCRRCIKIREAKRPPKNPQRPSGLRA